MLHHIRRCRECEGPLDQTGRLTWYCPECDVCPDCNCPRVDGFAHYQGCESADLCDGCGEEPLNCECPRADDDVDTQPMAVAAKVAVMRADGGGR